MAKSVRRGEIWMTDLLNEDRKESSVMRGFRPCIVVSNEYTNTNPNSTIAMVIPLTSNALKGAMPTHVEVSKNESINRLKMTSTAPCEQITTCEKNQIRFFLGRVSDDEMKLIDQAILTALGM